LGYLKKICLIFSSTIYRLAYKKYIGCNNSIELII
jgi:hypothetical protein